MLDHYQHDLNYLKARHALRLREIEAERSDSPGLYELKDRMFSAMGDTLIAVGRKLKGEMKADDLARDCA